MVGSGCIGAQPAGYTEAQTIPVVEPWAFICPPVIGGADAAMERTESGVVLALTASPGMAEDVDQRVRRLAESLAGRGGVAPAASPNGLGAMEARGATLPRVRVSVSTVDGGARLVLEAVDRKEAALLGEQVAALLHRMLSGGCPPLPTRPQTERTPAPPVQQPSGHQH